MWDLGETGGTVALRMPDDPVALALLREVGPMAVSSANRTGHPASRTVVEAASQLGAAVEFYLDGGPVTGGLASTIVDCTREEPVFLRVGALSEAEVMDVVERVRADALELSRAEPDATESDHTESDDTESDRTESDDTESDDTDVDDTPSDDTDVDDTGSEVTGPDEPGAPDAPTASEQRETTDDD